jgi:hypothetical protein
MKILLDSDLYVDIIVNSSGNSLNLELLEQKMDSCEYEFCITSIGWNKIVAIILASTDDEDNVDKAITMFGSLVKIIDVMPHQYQLARTLNTDDFETAIEFACAQECGDITAILTNKEDNFSKLKDLSTRVWNMDFFNLYLDGKHAIENLSDYQIELLFVLTLLKKPLSKEVLMNVFSIHSVSDENVLLNELNELKRMSLISELTQEKYGVNSCYVDLVMALTCQIRSEKTTSMMTKISEAYFEIARKYGGLDYGYYYEKYDVINAEWDNFIVILSFCYDYSLYTLLELMWDKLNHFADLYGYYHERIIWNERLAEIAKIKQSWNSHVLHLAREAWTYIVWREPNTLRKANDLLKTADSYFEQITPATQLYLLHNMFVHRIYTEDIVEASKILIRQEHVLKIYSQNSPDERIITRANITFLRDQARLSYAKGDIELAKQQFQSVLEKSQEFNWLRYVSYVNNKLADINIEQMNLDEAKKYLDEGYPIAEKNKNKRRQAGYAKSFAQIERLRGNEKLSLRWEDLARELLNSIGLTHRAKQVSCELDIFSKKANRRQMQKILEYGGTKNLGK